MYKKHARGLHHTPGAFFYGKRGEIPIRINSMSMRADEPFPEEKSHYHKESTQYFVVLEGMLTIEVDGEIVDVIPEAGLEITPGTPYRSVRHTGDTTFIVVGDVNKEEDRVQPE